MSNIKFLVSRTSDWRQENAPCEGVIKEKNGWTIELSSIQSLLDFIEQEGFKVIITPSWSKNEMPEIEIYDDYRE